MEGHLQFDIGDVDLEQVDCEENPQSVLQYLRQVAAQRMRIPEVVNAGLAEDLVLENVACATEREISRKSDPHRANWKWQMEIVEYFDSCRRQVENLSEVTPFEIEWPSIYSPREWLEVILERRVSELPSSYNTYYLQYAGTPPLPQVILSLSKVQVDNLLQILIRYIIYDIKKKEDHESAVEHSDAAAKTTTDSITDDQSEVSTDEPAEQITAILETSTNMVDEEDTSNNAERLTNPCRVWIYALLLILERSYLPDIVASLREFVTFCRRHRLDQQKDPFFSMMIAIISHSFGQKDLSD